MPSPCGGSDDTLICMVIVTLNIWIILWFNLNGVLTMDTDSLS